MSAQKGSSITTDKQGAISKADLTASTDTTWNFDNKQYRVPEGGRLLYDNGKITVELPKDSSLNVKSGDMGYTIKNPLEQAVSITQDSVTGNNFQVDDLACSGISGGSCSIKKISSNEYIIKEGGQIGKGSASISSIKGDLKLTNGGEMPSFATQNYNQAWLSGNEVAGKAGTAGTMSYSDSRGLTTQLQNGAEGYSGHNSLSLDVSKGGVAKLFTPDQTIVEANGNIVNIKRGSVNIPFTDITIIPYTEQVTYFSNEGGGGYHAFYALSDPNKGPSVAYIADASFLTEGVSKLSDFGYCGKVGMVCKF